MSSTSARSWSQTSYEQTNHAAPLGESPCFSLPQRLRKVRLAYRASSEDKTEGVDGFSQDYPHPWELRSSTYGPLNDTLRGVAWLLPISKNWQPLRVINL